MTGQVPVWDVRVRLFHRSFAGIVKLSWRSGENHETDWNRQSGLLVLLLFGLFWGLAGSRTARFARFLKRPCEVIAYVGKVGDEHATDWPDPLGGWSVAALLLVLLTLVGALLFAVDVDGQESGQLLRYHLKARILSGNGL